MEGSGMKASELEELFRTTLLYMVLFFLLGVSLFLYVELDLCLVSDPSLRIKRKNNCF